MRQVGRNQFVLDLTRREVRDYLFDAIALLLSSANIEYLKVRARRSDGAHHEQTHRCLDHPPTPPTRLTLCVTQWDFNRPLTEVFSQRQQCSPDRDMAGHSLPFPEDGPGAVCEVGRPPVWQSETSHRFVLGLYELQARVTHAFPHVLLENCSSGGGRFDPVSELPLPGVTRVLCTGDGAADRLLVTGRSPFPSPCVRGCCTILPKCGAATTPTPSCA